MKRQVTMRTKNDLGGTATELWAVSSYSRQDCLDQMRPIIVELHALLPAYQRCVGKAQYDAERSDLMRLTARYCDNSLDISALETVLQHLKWHQRMFATALG